MRGTCVEIDPWPGNQPSEAVSIHAASDGPVACVPPFPVIIMFVFGPEAMWRLGVDEDISTLAT